MKGQFSFEYVLLIMVMIVYIGFVIIPLYNYVENLVLIGLKLIKFKTAIQQTIDCIEEAGTFKSEEGIQQVVYFPNNVYVEADDRWINFRIEKISVMKPFKMKITKAEIMCDYNPSEKYYYCDYNVLLYNKIKKINNQKVPTVFIMTCRYDPNNHDVNIGLI